MGRPPNPHGRRGAEAAKKQFVVPIPPVEPRLQAEIESNIASTHPWLVQRAQLDQAESQLVASQTRLAEEQHRVQHLTTTRNTALEEIATLRQGQLETILQNLQLQQRREFAQQQKAQRLALEQECMQMYNTVPQQQQEEEELPSKKRRMEQDEQDTVETMSCDTEEMKSATADEETVTNEQQEPKPSDAKRKQLEEAEHQVEELTNTKHEMIWLLKQVIKAEQKQKIQAKTSTTTDSKAAA